MDISGNNQDGSPATQEFDHYDFINAPQYVDFAELAQNDDPNADIFFDNHREEDDFFIPIENITPTLQLLKNEQNTLSLLSANQNKVNKVAVQAGMDDVKVVYYSSPSNQNYNNSRLSTGLMAANSLNSSISSFHTPMGDFSSIDKENFAPSPEPLILNPVSKDDTTIVAKKLSYSAAVDDLDTDVNKTFTADADEIATPFFVVSQADPNENHINKQESKAKLQFIRTSLSAQLDKLHLLSSDDEDAGVERIEESYQSPTLTPIKTDDDLVENILKTPGGKKPKLTSTHHPCKQTSTQKLDFFEGISLDDSNSYEANIIDSPNKEKKAYDDGKIKPNELNTESVEQKTNEEFFKNEFPIFTGPQQDDRKQSFLVDPSIGQEIVWNNDEVIMEETKKEMIPETVMLEEFFHLNEPTEVVEDNEADDTLTSSFDAYHDYQEVLEKKKETKGMQRRASSLSDLTNLQKKNIPVNKPIARNIKTGLTIPHSPEASRRPTKCRSAIKTTFAAPDSSWSQSIVRVPFELGLSISGRAPVTPLKFATKSTTVPYKGSVATTRVPLKANHYVSLAEAITKFQKNTPDRFRTLPRGRIPIKRSASCDLKPEERGKSPQYSPKTSNRSQTSSASRNKGATLAFMKAPRTSCAPMNQSNNKGMASFPKRATVPQPFHFAAPRARNTKTKEDVQDFKFKARPAPLANGMVTGLKDKPHIKATQPMSLHFASDDRIRERKEKAQSSHSPVTSRPGTVQSHLSIIKPSRIPTLGFRAPTPDLPLKAATAMKPFSFDERDQKMLRRKEEKIKQEHEEKMKHREFHANPLPNFLHKLPKKKAIPNTNVKPFHLKSDERGEAYQETLKQKLEEEERRLKELTIFHANPPVVLHKPAFEPEHPLRSPMEPVEFHLNTEVRAAEREQFDQYLKLKEMEDEVKRQEEQARVEELQRQEEIDKRRQLVHKAKPFRLPKPFELKASEKTLTIPHSPAFLPLPSQRRTSPSKTVNHKSD